MDIPIERKKHTNIRQYRKEDIDIVYEFSKNIKKELGGMLKAIVLFGSTARKMQTHEKANDIDILLVLDDVTVSLTPELTHTYRIIVEKTILKISRRIHVTTLRFTSFWEYMRAGDPVAINILRDGVPILDSGFFEPLQILLYQGRIRPSAESVQNYLAMAPQTLQNSKGHILQATVDLYWAVIDAAHAALMSINETPPSPAHAADMLEEKLVKKGLIHKKYAGVMRNFYQLGKGISHGQILDVSGDQYDMYYKEAYDFVAAMKRFIEGK